MQDRSHLLTEQRLPESLHLDSMSITDALSVMNAQDARAVEAVRSVQSDVARAIELVVTAFVHNGRLFYVGAGTSGRLGVLDASECPPTFRTDPQIVQGIIAGGDVALRCAVEGAEDDAKAGAREIRTRRITARDVVVGIAASGTTKFVWGALGEAKRRRAATMLICFNPHLAIPTALCPDLVITPDLGPE